MSLARVLLCSLVVSALVLPIAARASAKPKKAAKTAPPESADDSAASTSADAKSDDDDADAPAPSKRGAAKSSSTSADAAKDAKDAPEKSPASASTDASPRPSPFDLELGFLAVNRNFTYKDTPAQLFPNQGYPTLVPFQLALGPALFFDGTVYPGALASSDIAAHLGLTFGYELNFATNADFAPGTALARTLHTQASQFYVGGRARIPLGVHELGFIAAYGQQKFEVLGDESAPLVPDVHYKFVRLSVDAKLAFGDVSLGSHVGTRLVSDTGGLRSDWFPNTKTKSIEAGIFLSYRLSGALDVVAALDLVRYVFDFNPIPPQTDPWSTPVAGGATDQYITGSLALRFHVPADKAAD